MSKVILRYFFSLFIDDGLIPHVFCHFELLLILIRGMQINLGIG